MNIEEMRKYYLVTTEHLEDKLWFREVEDFPVGMNYVALQAALCPEIVVLAFILMSNHVHFVLNGTKDKVSEFVNAFKGRYSLYLYRKYGIREHLRENGLHLKEINIQEPEALERNIAYVQMNCVAAGICAHPSQYPWGTGNAFFTQGVSHSVKRLSSMSGRARKRLIHSEMALNMPGEWLVADYVLPESYVKVEAVERLFRSASRMNYFLNTSSKARKRLEAEEDRMPAFKDQIIMQALPDLIRGLFHKTSFEELTHEEQAESLRQIRYRFSANVHQAARVCGLSYEDAARLLDSA